MSARDNNKHKTAEAEAEAADDEPPDDAVPYAGPTARVPITSGYADRATAGWLTSPYALERRFRYYARSYIPDDYVKRFQHWLNSGRFLETTRCREHDRWSDVLRCKAEVMWGGRRLVALKQYFSRPCAWQLGFVRLLFLHLLRFCHYHNLDLYIVEPAPTTTAFVRRIRAHTPGAIVEEEAFVGDTLLHIKLPFTSLRAFAGGMGADTTEWACTPDQTKTDGQCELPKGQRLTLDPADFPPARALNVEDDDDA
jgi:hypothetical protein